MTHKQKLLSERAAQLQDEAAISKVWSAIFFIFSGIATAGSVLATSTDSPASDRITMGCFCALALAMGGKNLHKYIKTTKQLNLFQQELTHIQQQKQK